VLLGAMPAVAAEGPNILIIIADDLGFADLGSFGGEIPTPNLDRLAYAGVRFSDFQVAPACSPTRAALLTGVDPHLAGVGSLYEELAPNQKGKPGYEGHLNSKVVSVATRLRDGGYRTYLSGKWHLGNEPEQGPGSQGFQRSFALLSGGASHFDDMRPAYHPDPNARAAYVDQDRLLKQLPADFDYSSQYYADRLLNYLHEDAKSEKPFFAVLAFTAPHWPLQAPAAVIDKYAGNYDQGYEQLYSQRLARARKLGLLAAGVPDSPRPPNARPWQALSAAQKREQSRAMAVYAAMVDQLDFHSGRVIDYLEQTAQLDNTLILFMSDNGPEGHDLDETWPAEQFPAIRKVIDERHDFSYDNMGKPGSYTLYGPGWARAGSPGLRMYKGFPSEGGTRVCAFVHYPARIKGGRIERETIAVKDIAPTLLDYAGVREEGTTFGGRPVLSMQGHSRRAEFEGLSTASESSPLGTELFGKYAMRKDNYKLLHMPPPYGNGKLELYDLAADPGESVNLVRSKPEQVERMRALWKQYSSDNGVILPDWVSGY
jgi:arylsulfatase A-like enzyme